jgi:hypothetical protein
MIPTTTTEDPMSKPLSPAAVSAILGDGQWIGSDRVRLRCTHRTDPVLRKAGVLAPVPLEDYVIPVRRDHGLLVIDREAHPAAPSAIGEDSLFEPGGIFAGETPPAPNHSLRSEINLIDSPEIAAELRALAEIPATRSFQIPVHPQSRIRILICAFDDESFPSPCEPEQWQPRRPSDAEVHAAVSALHMVRRLPDLEQI